MAIHFFSYGDEKYKNSKFRIKQEAMNMGFDVINVYGKEDIEQEFLERTHPHISHPRGSGYWLWKAFFLKKTLEKMSESDFCIYADAGCHLNIHGKSRLEEYLNMVSSHSSGFLGFELVGFKEKMYTNSKCLEYFGYRDESSITDSSILVGGILILRKNDITIKIIDEFYKIAIDWPDLFSDIHNNYNPLPEFIDHRHDQSILSMLRKKYGYIGIPDETYSENWSELMHVPILATRIRN